MRTCILVSVDVSCASLFMKQKRSPPWMGIAYFTTALLSCVGTKNPRIKQNSFSLVNQEFICIASWECKCLTLWSSEIHLHFQFPLAEGEQRLRINQHAKKRHCAVNGAKSKFKINSAADLFFITEWWLRLFLSTKNAVSSPSRARQREHFCSWYHFKFQSTIRSQKRQHEEISNQMLRLVLQIFHRPILKGSLHPRCKKGNWFETFEWCGFLMAHRFQLLPVHWQRRQCK
jgi:hypothetical protein